MQDKNVESFDEIKNRLLQFAKEQGLIMGDFYEKIGVAPSNFSGKAMESALKSDNLVKVLKAYPELSADWLLLEKGEMLRKNNLKNMAVASAPQANASNGDMSIQAPAELLQLLASQQQTINNLSEIIKTLTAKDHATNL